MIIHCRVKKIEKETVADEKNDSSDYWEWIDKTEKAMFESVNKNSLKK